MRNPAVADVVEVDGLHKVFHRRVRAAGLRGMLAAYRHPRSETIEAVRRLSMRIGDGEALALIGPNGAGKSTTIKMLTGILHPTRGSARVLGLVPWHQRTTLAMNIATVFGQRSQ
jgi:ABC-2 type transport system ATP-binding protein